MDLNTIYVQCRKRIRKYLKKGEEKQMIITGIIKLFVMFLALSLYTIIGLVIFMVTQLILYRVFKFNLYKKLNKILWKE